MKRKAGTTIFALVCVLSCTRLAAAQEAQLVDNIPAYKDFLPFTDDPIETSYWSHAWTLGHESAPNELTIADFLERASRMVGVCTLYRQTLAEVPAEERAHTEQSVRAEYMRTCLGDLFGVLFASVVPQLRAFADSAEPPAYRIHAQILLQRAYTLFNLGSGLGNSQSRTGPGGGISGGTSGPEYTPFYIPTHGPSPGVPSVGGGQSMEAIDALFKGQSPYFDGKDYVIGENRVPLTLIEGISEAFAPVPPSLPEKVTSGVPDIWRKYLEASASLSTVPTDTLEPWVNSGVQVEHVSTILNSAKGLESLTQDEGAATSPSESLNFLGQYVASKQTEALIKGSDPARDAENEFVATASGGFKTPEERALQPYLYEQYLKSHVPVQIMTESKAVDTTQSYNFQGWDATKNELLFSTTNADVAAPLVRLNPQVVGGIQIGADTTNY